MSGDYVVAEPVEKPAARTDRTIDLVPMADKVVPQQIELEVVEEPAPKKRIPVAEPVAEESEEERPKKDRKSKEIPVRKKKRQGRKDEEEEEKASLNRRDWLMLALGGIALGVAVLLVAGLVWGLHHLASSKPNPEADDTKSQSSARVIRRKRVAKRFGLRYDLAIAVCPTKPITKARKNESTK